VKNRQPSRGYRRVALAIRHSNRERLGYGDADQLPCYRALLERGLPAHAATTLRRSFPLPCSARSDSRLRLGPLVRSLMILEWFRKHVRSNSAARDQRLWALRCSGRTKSRPADCSIVRIQPAGTFRPRRQSACTILGHVTSDSAFPRL
jgi:hypothetical protein